MLLFVIMYDDEYDDDGDDYDVDDDPKILDSTHLELLVQMNPSDQISTFPLQNNVALVPRKAFTFWLFWMNSLHWS